MSAPRISGAVLASSAVALAVVVTGTAHSLRERPTERARVLRSSDAGALANVTWEQPQRLRSEPMLLRSRFPAELNAWHYVADPAQRAERFRLDDDELREQSFTAPGSFARFRESSGALFTTLPARPGQLLEVRASVRQRSEEPAEGDPLRLFFVPLSRAIELDRFLTSRPLMDVLTDPGREFLCFGAPPPVFSLAADPQLATFQLLRGQVRTPGDAVQWLVGFTCAADPSADCAVQRVAVEALSARRTTGIGGLPESLAADAESRTLLDDGTHDPSAWSTLGLSPLDNAQTGATLHPSTLWRAHCLGEVRDAYVLPPPASMELELELPGGEAVLETALAVLHEPRENWQHWPIEVRMELEGVTVLQRTLDESTPSGWNDVRLECDGAARRATLRVEVRSDAGAPEIVVLAAPLVWTRAPADPRPNVILVSLDTFRVDRMSCEGYSRPTTPVLDELARRNWWFRRAYSTTSYTLPSHASMMTGQIPSRHGAVAPRAGLHRLSRKRSELLADRFHEAGWLTAGFTGGNFLGARHGFDLGFDRYSEIDPLLTDATTNWWRVTPVMNDLEFNLRHREHHGFDRALDWIRTHRESRFFLFLHTYLVHEYRPDPEFAERFAPGSEPADVERFLRVKGDKTIDARSLAPADLELGSALYDATLAQADAAIGRLVDTLRRLDLWYDTVLVITSDHGEEFLERGRLGHGRALTEDLLRVPLIIHAPGNAEPRRIEEPVSLVDIAPTILELAGLEPPRDADGRSLCGVPAAKPLIAELDLDRIQRLRTMLDGEEKLMVTAKLEEGAKFGDPEVWSEPRLFDVKRDPDETFDLSGRRETRALELREALQTRLESARRECLQYAVDGLSITAEDIERIQAIGYEAEDLEDGS